MGMSDSLDAQIVTDAGKPFETDVNGVRVRARTTQEQIAAAKYDKAIAVEDAIAAGKLPLMMFRHKPPGSV